MALDAWELARDGPTSSITGGGAISELERRLAAYCGVRFALGLSSGTLALRTALLAVGVRSTAEVVIPAFDWPAAAAATLSLDARPVPADVGAGSLHVSAEAVERVLTPRTKAVVVTHLAGVPAETFRLRAVCKAHRLPLVEDASQALGARDCRRPVGAIGDVGIFSLGPGKLLDVGEGGALVTEDERLFQAAVRATQHPTRQLLAGGGIPPHLLGLSARLHPLAAVLGLRAFEEIDIELARRRRQALEIRSRAESIEGLVIPAEQDGVRFSWPCVPALAGAEARIRVRQAGLGAAPLGAHDISALVGRNEAPHTRDAAEFACRLFIQEK